MKRYALIGHNISYSLSPLIHEVIYRKIGLEASYELISVDASELDKAVERLRGYDGFNITKPHKQNILPYLSGSHPKSVNTVLVENGTLTGYSTDGYGFVRDLELNFGKVSGMALVLGAGGVSRVIIEELKNMGLEVFIHNRTVRKAIELAQEFGVKAVADLSEVKPDLIVNCTSCGFNRGENPAARGGVTANGLAIDPSNVKWVYDTIYSPPETDFLLSFPSARRANGWGMLILQAVEADRILCRAQIDEDTEKEIYDEIMHELQSK